MKQKLIECKKCNLQIEWTFIITHLLKVHCETSLKCVEHQLEFNKWLDFQDHILSDLHLS